MWTRSRHPHNPITTCLHRLINPICRNYILFIMINMALYFWRGIFGHLNRPYTLKSTFSLQGFMSVISISKLRPLRSRLDSLLYLSIHFYHVSYFVIALSQVYFNMILLCSDYIHHVQ